MRTNSLKPFDDGKYLSEEEALKLLESIPIPKDDSRSASPAEEKAQTPVTENFDLENRIINLNPADNGATKTHEDWIAYFNARNEMMVSLPDIYQAGKSGNRSLLDSLRRDFKAGLIVTSTIVKYEDNQNATIIHNYGSKLVQPVEHKLVIPEYRPMLLVTSILSEKLNYLQSLFGTEDDVGQIRETLQKISNYTLNQINIWSNRLSERPDERILCLGYNSGFHVYGNFLYLSTGLSRAVHTNTTAKSGGSP